MADGNPISGTGKLPFKSAIAPGPPPPSSCRIFRTLVDRLSMLGFSQPALCVKARS